jgi:outer membrane protein insertion porin family
MRERPDGSGRHTLAYSFRLGVSGGQTPIFENYFTGGFSTMRGFDFRGASPLGPANVTIGGQFRFLGSVEYFFPITADDMIKGVFFCDFGTTEENIELNSDNYRVAPGFGLRINIPAMGPAPLALDLAVPVAHAPGDNIQNFSFFFGFSR